MYFIWVNVLIPFHQTRMFFTLEWRYILSLFHSFLIAYINSCTMFKSNKAVKRTDISPRRSFNAKLSYSADKSMWPLNVLCDLDLWGMDTDHLNENNIRTKLNRNLSVIVWTRKFTDRQPDQAHSDWAIPKIHPDSLVGVLITING